eukprot:gnl/TRDRNA2_/TRDRNA2_175235_c0_seq1.p1 gnl/TRDRNA2_/TRDRNA2_175235_c0~~gnl/TRDRNA2_/TRDRNA2_175235_c0_seq1.p1  ORF type:complete len:352 (+),score=-15.18 gnl/TRDRNA2_/TRDRNA2_175235_c0_seq1:89-1144(+)
MTTPVLKPNEVIERWRMASNLPDYKLYRAYFSSELGGITTEAAFMTVHVDDRWSQKSHVISHTSTIVEGKIYLLNRYLDRLFQSAAVLHISLPLPKEKILKVILETCAASLVFNGEVRFWLSQGHENENFRTPKRMSSFHVLVIEKEYCELEMPNYDERWRVITCSTQVKSGIVAEIDSRNSTENIICLSESRNSNAQQGILLDSDGFVVGCSGLDLLAYTGDKRLIVPIADDRTPDCRTQRILELVNQFLAHDSPDKRKDYEWLFENIKTAEFVSPMRPNELRSIASELFLVGGDGIIIPIFQWDEEWIGERFLKTDSELYHVIYKIVKLDSNYPGFDSSLLTSIPYSKN